jgi:hypothetical protein
MEAGVCEQLTTSPWEQRQRKDRDMVDRRWNGLHGRSTLIGVCGVAALLVTSLAMAQEQTPAPAPPPVASAPDAAVEQNEKPKPFLRIKEDKGKTIALEIATRDYERAGADGPKVALVGVAHIGDRSFYRAVQKLLDEYDVVLFESVKPEGTGGAGGETDEERIESTKAAMEFVAGLVESHHAKHSVYPADVAALGKFAADYDPRLGHMLNAAMLDAWGRAFVYEHKDIDATGAAPVPAQAPDAGQTPAAERHASDSYSLISLGADGRPGGEGVDGDLALADLGMVSPLPMSKEDNLQGQLADALGLEFQLEALDYNLPNWRCSDMSMDQVNRAFKERGLDFGLLGGTLAGSSLPAKLIGMMLNLMRVADQFLDGAIADTFKVMMIELLSDETLTKQGLAQMGAGFHEVIVVERNQVAINDLKAIIEKEPQIKSVAILYGAAHMADMAQELDEQLGYKPSEETWIPAIEVDLTQSAVTQREINQMRVMLRQMMRQQMR